VTEEGRTETRWMSIRTASTYLDVRPATLRAWINSGVLPCVRIRHRNPEGVGKHQCTLRLDRRAIDRILERDMK
jgi:predicted site-specific integrase-resolvase